MDRRELTRILDAAMVSGRDYFAETGRLPKRGNPVKSYLVEANVPYAEVGHDSIEEFLSSPDLGVRVTVQKTDDSTIHMLHVGRKQTLFYLDTLDPRFWIFHTIESASESDQAIRSLVNRTRLLDSAWLPTIQFENWSQALGVPRVLTSKFSVPTSLYQEELPDDAYFLDGSTVLRIGSSANAMHRWTQLRNQTDLRSTMALWTARIARRESETDRFAIDDITAAGKLTARGNSFYVHRQLLDTLKTKYSALIVGWEEKYRLGWSTDKRGLRPTGTTAVIRLPDPLSEDQLELLLSRLFDGGEPYRLYGAPIQQASDRYAVRSIDLHTGDKIDFEIFPDFIRIYLYPTTCGNVLARLLTNLQHFHDARTDLDESED